MKLYRKGQDQRMFHKHLDQHKTSSNDARPTTNRPFVTAQGNQAKQLCRMKYFIFSNQTFF